MDALVLPSFVIGALLGGALTFIWAKRGLADRVIQLSTSNAELTERLRNSELRAIEERKLLESAEQRLTDVFRSLSHQALQSNSAQLMSVTQTQLDGKHALIDQLGQELLKKLAQVDQVLRTFEQRRSEGEGALRTELSSLNDLTRKLGAETQQLRGALSNNRLAGSWGEAQLKNILTAAGLLPYCDFVEQASFDASQSDSGAERARPDVLVKFPNGQQLIIDAKAPTHAFLSYSEAQNAEDRSRALQAFTTQVQRHIRAVAKRDYASSVPNSFPYVVMFLPSEAFLLGALECDQSLIENADAQKILLTTPLSLLAFLKTISLSWQETNLQSHAKEIRALGYELLERLESFSDGFNQLGKSLSAAVKHFNQVSSSLDKRVLVSARRFREIEGGSAQDLLPSPPVLSELPRERGSPESL